jgi:hypothetical protein
MLALQAQDLAAEADLARIMDQVRREAFRNTPGE